MCRVNATWLYIPSPIADESSMPRYCTYICPTTRKEKEILAKMSTHTRLKALEAEAAKKKTTKKAKKAEDKADLSTPSF